MKQHTENGTIGTIAGVEQNPPIAFSYSWSSFETPQEMDAAGKRPSDADIVDFVNGNAERTALSSARAKASADVLEKIQNTREYKVSKLAKDIVAASNGAKSLSDATAIAETLVAAQ
jgi:hypothetical protein